MATQLKQVPSTPPDTLAGAMALAFGEIEGATKDAVNPAFKQGGKVSKYADLTAVIAAIKPALINHDLFFTQHPEPSDKGICIETVLHHASGERLSMGKLFVPANKQDAQGFGSALTYARRYALVTAFGVPVEDDDGNAAARSAPARQDAANNAPASPPQASDSDVVLITNLCKAVGGNQMQTICEAYNVSSLPELNARQAAAVLKRLQEKLAVAVSAEPNAKPATLAEELGDDIQF